MDLKVKVEEHGVRDNKGVFRPSRKAMKAQDAQRSVSEVDHKHEDAQDVLLICGEVETAGVSPKKTAHVVRKHRIDYKLSWA